MTDDEIRQIVRTAIAKHLGPSAEPSATGPAGRTFSSAAQSHAMVSFHRYAVPRAADDGACLIEPAVRCNQCGYCECHGH
jgi:hypothetical protein